MNIARPHAPHLVTRPWLPAALRDRSGQATPLAGDRGVDRQGIKRRLDDAEPLCASRALVGVLRYERTEVELDERCDADRSLDVLRGNG